MKYAFIEEQRTQFTIRRMCALLSVSHSGYYEWRDRAQSARDNRDGELVARVVAIHGKSRQTYGQPLILAALKQEGLRVGDKRVAPLMRRAAIRGVAPRRFCVTTDSRHNESISANVLARRFAPVEVSGPNRTWAGDVTFVPTKEAWLYLAVVLDPYSRMVVGWSMSAANDTQLVLLDLIDFCTTTTQTLMSAMKPDAILCFGVPAFDAMRGKRVGARIPGTKGAQHVEGTNIWYVQHPTGAIPRTAGHDTPIVLDQIAVYLAQ